jgi:hypothetical protein
VPSLVKELKLIAKMHGEHNTKKKMALVCIVLTKCTYTFLIFGQWIQLCTCIYPLVRTVIKHRHSHGAVTHSVTLTWPQPREPINYGSIPIRDKMSIYTGSRVYPGSCLLGTSRVAKQRNHEADHLLPCIAKVNNVWSYTSTCSPRQYAFIAWCLIKARNNFIFAFNMWRQVDSFTL